MILPQFVLSFSHLECVFFYISNTATMYLFILTFFDTGEKFSVINNYSNRVIGYVHFNFIFFTAVCMVVLFSTHPHKNLEFCQASIFGCSIGLKVYRKFIALNFSNYQMCWSIFPVFISHFGFSSVNYKFILFSYIAFFLLILVGIS